MPDLFRVLPELEDQTIAAALRRWLPGKSWGEIRQLLRARHVQINGNLCVDVGRRLKLTDVIKVLEQPAAAPPRADDVRVVYLDQHVAVVEKPSGLTSNRHREELNWPARRRQLQPTLDELLPGVIARMEPGRRVKGVPPPVRPVHRLDRETSGLMVFARTVRAERHLGDQFRRHTTQRRYLAIVEGNVEAQTISTQLVRDRGDGHRGSTPNPDVGKRAVTHIRPLEKFAAGYTLIECQLETGRTHQIRIHLSELGHPVCGERIYRTTRFGRPKPDRSGAPRLALHATELGFEHPITSEQLRFSMPLPKDLHQFLERLRQ
jgi:23S rRNA pseudouridine1911/1915/1917 synthase